MQKLWAPKKTSPKITKREILRFSVKLAKNQTRIGILHFIGTYIKQTI